MRNAQKKGATLSEMAIVLAVLAIISLVVVSFIVALNSRVKIAKAKLAAMQDIQAIESIVEKQIEQEYAISGNAPALTITDGVLKKGEETLYAFNSTVTGIACTQINNQTDETAATDAIFFVTLTYRLPNAEERYTFCVNPYIGDSIPLAGGVQ